MKNNKKAIHCFYHHSSTTGWREVDDRIKTVQKGGKYGQHPIDHKKRDVIHQDVLTGRLL